MGSLLTFFHILDQFLTFGWTIIFGADLFLRNFDPHKRRTARGKIHRWQMRTLGLFGDFWCRLTIGVTAMVACLAAGSSYPADIFWIYIAVVLAIDWITGSDDPPYRRWAASVVNKLKISPPPKPAIDLA